MLIEENKKSNESIKEILLKNVDNLKKLINLIFETEFDLIEKLFKKHTNM